MTLEELDFPETLYATTDDIPGSLQLRQVKALERIAAALESRGSQAPSLTPLPPVGATQTPPAPFDGCPIHHTPWKVVPAGVSKKTGKTYESFRACSVAGCDQRPAR